MHVHGQEEKQRHLRFYRVGFSLNGQMFMMAKTAFVKTTNTHTPVRLHLSAREYITE